MPTLYSFVSHEHQLYILFEIFIREGIMQENSRLGEFTGAHGISGPGIAIVVHTT